MKHLLLSLLIVLTTSVHGQSHLMKGDIAVKWDPTRLLNPFNSTIQLGAEYGITDTWSIQTDIGIKSGIYNGNRYKKGLFIFHSQVRKYQSNGYFLGADLFLVHAKTFNLSQCYFNKKDKFSASYDSVTLTKNAPGISLIAGKQIKANRFLFDFYTGVGIRFVNHQLSYKTISNISNESCRGTHYNWGSDQYSGKFIAGHISLGIKIGFLLN
jgi:hypothetical protein